MIDRLPKTWRTARLGDCFQRRRETLMPSSLSEGSVGLVGLEDIQDGGRGGITVRPTDPREIQSLKTRFEPGDILYGKLRPYLNKVGIAPEQGLCSTEIWAFGPSVLVDSAYAAFFLASSFFVDRVASLTKGANLPRLDTEAFDSTDIPLPPLSEQQRIVEILQEAEAIRRLRAEAEAKAAELIPAMFDAYFGDPVANPRKWKVAPLGDLLNGTAKNGLYKPEGFYGDGTPIVRIGDFAGAGFPALATLQRLRASEEEISQFGVSEGKILLNRVNSIEHLGKCLLVPRTAEAIVFESNMMRLEPNPDRVRPQFLFGCLRHASILAKLRAKAKRAVNQASINQNDVLTLKIPIPNADLQDAFVSAVMEVESLRQTMEVALSVEKATSASLCAHAFSGKLTADWREAHKEKLALEARERDAALKAGGATLSLARRATLPEIETIFEERTDGIYSDLNREQRGLVRFLESHLGGVDYGRYFTAESLAAETECPLFGHPQAVESHLSVLAIRGIVIPVSRLRYDAVGNRFAASYRIALPDDDVRKGWMRQQRRLATGDI